MHFSTYNTTATHCYYFLIKKKLPQFMNFILLRSAAVFRKKSSPYHLRQAFVDITKLLFYVGIERTTHRVQPLGCLCQFDIVQLF